MKSGAGFNLSNLQAIHIDASNYYAEKNISSTIKIVPTSGYFIKTKERKISKLIYEAFGTLFFSELLNLYNGILAEGKALLYSPPALRADIEVPEILNPKINDGKLEDLIKSDIELRIGTTTTITQCFCPGRPFNHVRGSKELIYKVKDEEVRVEYRMIYLAGILYGILKKEEIAHGDPALRHFILLPNESELPLIDEGLGIKKIKGINGIATVDVENFCLDEVEAKNELKKFNDVFTKSYLHLKGMKQYFEEGQERVLDSPYSFKEEAFNNAKNLFERLFSDRFEVNPFDRKVYCRKD